LRIPHLLLAICLSLGDELITDWVDLDATTEYQRFFEFKTYRQL